MMKNKKLYVWFVLLLVMLVTGCASNLKPSSHLRQVSLGMSKEEVVSVLGEPMVARGAIRNKYNQVVEVWEYTLALPSKDSAGQIAGKTALTIFTLGMGAAAFRAEKKDYWLYFLDDKLVQWGEAGDWKKEPQRIYEFNFNPSPTLNK
jgi:hypothetical protein